MSGIAVGAGGGGGGGGSIIDAYGAGIIGNTLVLTTPFSTASLKTIIALGLPAGYYLLAVSGRVEVAPTGNGIATATAGDGLMPALYAPAFSVAAGTTWDWWTSPPSGQGNLPLMTNGSESVVLTANAIPATGGSFMLHLAFWQIQRALL